MIRPSVPPARRAVCALAAAALALSLSIAARAEPPQTFEEPASSPTHGVAMHGAPLLPPDFDHFPYANPAAKKGGRLRVGLPGTFDSVNPFNIKAGSTAQGLVGNVFQTLMARSQDEPFTFYGQIAQFIACDLPSRSARAFLRRRAAHLGGCAVFLRSSEN
jgi:peptide/nickel transport system substrate-binding protein